MTKATSKQDASKSGSVRFWRELRGYAEAFAIAYVVVTFLFTTVGVVGSSMTPNLTGASRSNNVLLQAFSGDRVFIPKYDTWLRRMGVLPMYRRGEVIVVREPPNSPTRGPGSRSLQKLPLVNQMPFVQGRPFFIKRLVAHPGDRVRIEAGQVYVNGHAIDQGFITDSGVVRPASVNYPEVEVKEGAVTAFKGLSWGTYTRAGGAVAVPDAATEAEYAKYADNKLWDICRSIYPGENFALYQKSRLESSGSVCVEKYYRSTLDALTPVPEDAPAGLFVHEMTVPEGHYMVMGDNRLHGGSVDSRYFGPVPMMSVAGKATAVIWPPMREGGLNWRGLKPPEAFSAIPDAD